MGDEVGRAEGVALGRGSDVCRGAGGRGVAKADAVASATGVGGSVADASGDDVATATGVGMAPAACLVDAAGRPDPKCTGPKTKPYAAVSAVRRATPITGLRRRRRLTTELLPRSGGTTSSIFQYER